MACAGKQFTKTNNMNNFDKLVTNKHVRAVLMLIAFMLMVIMSHAQIGYLVVEKTKNQIIATKTIEADYVKKVAKKYDIDAEKLLKESNYFEVKTDTWYLYVEKKEVVRKKKRIRYRKIKATTK